MTSKRDVSLIFSERIKFLRDEHDLTQEQLAHKLTEAGFKISNDIISSLERNNVEPKMSHIEAYCKFFNVTPDFLLGYTQSYSRINKDGDDYEFVIELYKMGISKNELKNTKRVINVLLDLVDKE